MKYLLVVFNHVMLAEIIESTRVCSLQRSTRLWLVLRHGCVLLLLNCELYWWVTIFTQLVKCRCLNLLNFFGDRFDLTASVAALKPLTHDVRGSDFDSRLGYVRKTIFLSRPQSRYSGNINSVISLCMLMSGTYSTG